MAALERLAKSLDSLKSLISMSSTVDESGMRCKEKMSLCVIMTDMICTPEAKKAVNFQFLLANSMETLFKMCNDDDSNIRMIADECLNKIIRVHMDTNVVKLSIELYREIQRNQSARSLRAALWRFAELSHLIRPMRAKIFTPTLVQCMKIIARRKEEAVLETLSSSIPKMLTSSGCFMTDSDVKQLLETFMLNIHSENAVFRRTASSSILSICLYCPKPQFFIIHTLSSLLDNVIPLKDDENTYTVLGVLNCLRGLICHLEANGKETFLYGSFGTKRKHKKEVILSVDSVIQIYELCLHWTHHPDHNIVTAALETLNELLTAPPRQLEAILVSDKGLERSRIHTVTNNWKLSNRTLSEISVATTSTLALMEDTHFMDAEDMSPTSNLAQWLQDGETKSTDAIPSQPILDLIPDFPDCESEASVDLSERPRKTLLPEGGIVEGDLSHSPEPDLRLREVNSPSPPLQAHDIMEWDIGEAVESKNCPLIYCARRLVTAFLVPEYTNTRVSVRALALNCVSQVIRLKPSIFYENVDKNGLSTDQGFSQICDVLCFANHSDPQLRGLVRILIGTFINSKHNHSQNNINDQFSNKSKNLNLEKLINYLIEGLEDESAVCVRHTLTGLNLCLINLMESNNYCLCIPVLDKLLNLVNNPYWLVKVKLVELLCNLPYQCIHYITGNGNYQSKVFDFAIFELLSNEDDRVRKTTAEGISKLVSNLYFPIDYAQETVIVARGTKISLNLFSNVYNMKKGSEIHLQKIFLENNLSRIVAILVKTLHMSSSKHLSYGCIETLALLSEHYLPSNYCLGWNLPLISDNNNKENGSNVNSSGLFSYLVTLLTSSPLSLDLECHHWLLKLISNLYAGLASNALCIEDKRLASGAEALLSHTMKMLFIFVQVMEDHLPLRMSGSSPLKRKPRSSSPTKVSTTDKEGKEEKKIAMGHYGMSPQYVKLYDIIRAGYTNYQLTLDAASSEKFLNLISYTLKCIEKLLINSKLIDGNSIADELLPYLGITFVLDSTSTVKVVNQLMKSVCETNFPPVSKEKTSEKENKAIFHIGGFYENILRKPLQSLSHHLSSQISVDQQGKGKVEPVATRTYDREELTRKIKLFQSIVIQSLKEYTVTNNVKLQVEVLALLTQLVHLKVNYCLLDSDLVFLKFVKKQLEYLEAGQIRQPELLVPQIYTFLVSLINEKNHSKMVVNIPEIIQTCDELMACGQNPVTHSIPALKPVVQHVFMFNTTNYNDEKELETQREVVLAMLIKLAEYPQVLDILHNLMTEGWRWEDHWKRWYRQTIDAIKPLLAEGRLLVTECGTLHALLSLNSNFAAPLNNILALLFTHQQEGQSLEHWLGMLTTMLFSVCTYKEEKILLQLEEMNLYVREEGDDPLKVNAVSKTIAPQDLLAKLLLRVIKTIALKFESILTTNNTESNIEDLEKMFSSFLLCCVLLFQSGNYEEVSKSMAVRLQSNSDLETIHKAFLTISNKSPLQTLLWAEILMLLGLGDQHLWSALMIKNSSQKYSLNLQVVKQGSIILYCEYLANFPNDTKSLQWFLENYIEDVVINCQELPIEKLLCSIYNLETSSKTLLDALSKCVKHSEPVFIHRLLRTLENIHSNYTGLVLCLVAQSIINHKNIAIARLAAAFCSRSIEYMMTLDKIVVQEMLKKEQLVGLLKSLNSCQKQYRRHNALISILKKLGEQVYGINTKEYDIGEPIMLENISATKLDKKWLLEQIINKCCKNSDLDSRKSARLLSQLDIEELKAVMSSSNFNKNILQHCFCLGTQIYLQNPRNDKSCSLMENISPIYDCARTLLLHSVNKVCKNLPQNDKGIHSNEKLNEILLKIDIKTEIIPLALGMKNYLLSFKDLLTNNESMFELLPEKNCEIVSRFGLFCVQIIHWVVNRNFHNVDNWPWMIQELLECSASIFSFDFLTSFLKLDDISLVSLCIFDFYKAVTGKEIIIQDFKTDCDTEEVKDENVISDSSLQIASLVSWIETLNYCPVNIPVQIYKCLRSIIISLGRNQKVNWLCRTPVDAWQLPIDIKMPPPIPIQLLHDTEILFPIVYRIKLFGWIDRHQFEEMWVCLLSALSPNPDIDNIDQEEISSIMQANSLAIDGITWLVLSTLSVTNGNSYNRKLLHVPRVTNDKLHSLSYWKRLEEMNEKLRWKMKTIMNDDTLQLIRVDQRPNLERILNYSEYGMGQLSVSYLQAQITEEEGLDDAEGVKQSSLKIGNDVDIRSCVQFVLDLYGQWVLPNSGISLNLQLSMVKSILCLSDTFTERNHYEWMFNTFMSMARNHPSHDEIMHQYLVLGISKAAAVLNITEGERSEKVLKILETSLKSLFVPTKLAGLNSLLYLLQNVQYIKKTEPNVEIQKLSSQEFRNKILQFAVEYIQKYFIIETVNNLEEDFLLILALVMYLIEVYPEEGIDLSSLIKTISHVVQSPSNDVVYQSVIQGLERLVLIGNTGLNEQITRLALDRFSQADPKTSLPALQLLIACVYSEKIDDDNTEPNLTDKPPWAMEIMEKTSALFDKIKRGYPIEVEIVCEILPGILSDFLPALDVLTKVIGEFLSPNQPHKKDMAAMVFQVFTQACSEQQLPLLQDWLVHSLNNFTHNLPAVTAIWSLCCFFISASTNPWLRALFPHVQSRIRQYDYEDRQISCIAAVEFYKQLNPQQQEIFKKSFKETNSNQRTIFSDIVACL